MKWIAKESEQMVWHKWFAWYPVTIGYYRVWLEPVLRKGRICRGIRSNSWSWDYKRYPSKKQVLRDGRRLSEELIESVEKERYNCGEDSECS